MRKRLAHWVAAWVLGIACLFGNVLAVQLVGPSAPIVLSDPGQGGGGGG